MYMDWVLLVLGYSTSAYVDHTVKPPSQLALTLVKRFANLAFDYALVVVAVPWVRRFCAGTPASPLEWRWKVKCQDEEVVFRVSRASDARALWEAYGSGRGEQENPVMALKIMPAVDKYWMHDRTGYQMIQQDWDLDFASMIRATELIDQGKMKIRSFEKTVLVYSDAHGWLAWQLFPLDEKVAEEEAREKIVQFKVCRGRVDCVTLRVPTFTEIGYANTTARPVLGSLDRNGQGESLLPLDRTHSVRKQQTGWIHGRTTGRCRGQGQTAI